MNEQPDAAWRLGWLQSKDGCEVEAWVVRMTFWHLANAATTAWLSASQTCRRPQAPPIPPGRSTLRGISGCGHALEGLLPLGLLLEAFARKRGAEN